MTSNYHTPITTGAADNAATFNSPLGQLDSAVTDLGTKTNASIGMSGLQMIWNSATSVSVGIGMCFAENGDFINVTSVLVKSGLSLSVSTWYHIYVYLSAGVAAAEVVTTAPVAWKGTAYSKTGDTSRRYVGSIKSDASGNVYKFMHNPLLGSVLYMKYQVNGSPFRALTSGTASVATAVSLSGIVPITSRVAYMRVASSGDQALYTSDDNGVSATQCTVALLVGTTVTQANQVYHPTDISQQVFYKYNAAVVSGSCNIDVAGYIYER